MPNTTIAACGSETIMTPTSIALRLSAQLLFLLFRFFHYCGLDRHDRQKPWRICRLCITKNAIDYDDKRFAQPPQDHQKNHQNEPVIFLLLRALFGWL